MKSGRIRAVSILFAGTTLVAGCGGGSHFKNETRPPVPVQLTGVVTDRAVEISPHRVGAGPVVITVSNQTTAAHTLTLEGPGGGGGGTTDTVGPLNPMGTGKLQQTLRPGSYTLKAGSQQATAQQIMPGRVTVTRQRQSSSNDLLLP
jgi:hypothetical protein